MERPYIQHVHISGFDCVKDAEFALSPLHALIGPNDSGKSTVLRAIWGAIECGRLPEREWAPSFVEDQSCAISFSISQGLDYALIRRGTGWNGVVTKFDGSQETGDPRLLNSDAALHRAKMLRLDPDALRQASVLRGAAQSSEFEDSRGTGLANVLDHIRERDVDAFLEIQEALRRRFPSVEKLQTGRVAVEIVGPEKAYHGYGKAVAVRLNIGAEVPAERMSEGMLYYLAFETLRHSVQPSIFLVEEPENGLHPARIADAVRILREISETTQVVIATHSPLVINELKPEEVSVVTRTETVGTKVTPISKTPDFEERSKVYALGELWLSHCNGIDEAALLEGGPRP